MSDAFPATRWTNDEVRMAKREVPVSVWAWACSVSLQTIGDRSLNTEAVVVGHVRCPKDRLRPAAVQAVKALSDGDGAVRSVDWSQCRPLLGVHCRTLSPTRHRTTVEAHSYWIAASARLCAMRGRLLLGRPSPAARGRTIQTSRTCSSSPDR